VHVEEMGN